MVDNLPLGLDFLKEACASLAYTGITVQSREETYQSIFGKMDTANCHTLNLSPTSDKNRTHGPKPQGSRRNQNTLNVQQKSEYMLPEELLTSTKQNDLKSQNHMKGEENTVHRNSVQPERNTNDDSLHTLPNGEQNIHKIMTSP